MRSVPWYCACHVGALACSALRRIGSVSRNCILALAFYRRVLARLSRAVRPPTSSCEPSLSAGERTPFPQPTNRLYAGEIHATSAPNRSGRNRYWLRGRCPRNFPTALLAPCQKWGIGTERLGGHGTTRAEARPTSTCCSYAKPTFSPIYTKFTQHPSSPSPTTPRHLSHLTPLHNLLTYTQFILTN